MSSSRPSSALTPGRRRTANKENLYFEPGKGRKTGVSLRDTGIRDEHGFEPVSGIFNTPMLRTPARYSLPEPLPAQSVSRSGRTGRSPLKHRSPQKTHIGGSAVRRSPHKSFPIATVDDAADTRLGSPQASPQGSASRSLRPRKSLFAIDSPAMQVVRRRSPSIEIDEAINDVTQTLEDHDPVFQADDRTTVSVYPEPSHNSPAPYSASISYNGSQEPDQVPPQNDDTSRLSNSKRKRSSVLAPTAVMQPSSPASAKRRRHRNSHPSTMDDPEASVQYDTPLDYVPEQTFDGPVDQQSIHETTELDQDTVHETTEIDQDSLQGDTAVDLVNLHDTLSNTQDQSARKRGRPKKNQATRHSDPQPQTDSYGDGSRGARAQSTVRLRSVTPFDDGAKVTRYGRVTHKPLQFWKNEKVVYEHGEATGLIRAQDVTPQKRQVNRRRTNTKTRVNRDNVEEEIPEDLLPEAWEQETKIIRGPVAFWNPETGGNDGSEISEDVAFSHHASTYLDAGGGKFKYAKIMRIPFFGAGMLEIPPNGCKAPKSSRNMQMVFFMHEGKVTVDIQGMQFGITAGGCFSVPRGNTYSIMNESNQFTARIFFSQACEPEVEIEEG